MNVPETDQSYNGISRKAALQKADEVEYAPLQKQINSQGYLKLSPGTHVAFTITTIEHKTGHDSLIPRYGNTVIGEESLELQESHTLNGELSLYPSSPTTRDLDKRYNALPSTGYGRAVPGPKELQDKAKIDAERDEENHRLMGAIMQTHPEVSTILEESGMKPDAMDSISFSVRVPESG
jgi:hypothetical protein